MAHQTFNRIVNKINNTDIIKALIYSPTGLTSKQLGLAIEVTEDLQSKGLDITFILCNSILDNCYFNKSHNILGCIACQSRTLKLLEYANISNKQTIALSKYRQSQEFNIPFFSNTDELLNFKLEGIQIGRGAASSIISHTRDYYITSSKYSEIIAVELRKSANVLYNFIHFYDTIRPQIVYIFNGRFAEVYPAMELAIKRKIEFYTVEAGAKNKFELYHNALPHSLETRTSSITHYWQSSKDKMKSDIGAEWFKAKRFKNEEFERSFTINQISNKLPPNLDTGKTNIAIFNSSEDELKAIVEWNTHLFKFQNEAINEVVKYFKKHSSFHFYLRVHPNLGRVWNRQMDEIKLMAYHNLTVIPPDSSVDSYFLIDSCDKVLSFGSTMGVEASYWQKPSILFGNAFYKDLSCTYNPESFDELIGLLMDKELTPFSPNNSLKYGYYMSVYGKATKYFEFGGLSKSKYKGKSIKLLYLSKVFNLLKYFKYINHWRKLHRIYFGSKFLLFNIFKYK